MTLRNDEKPLRADAARNRARVLDAARDAFASADGPVVLEAVARTAGVGIGTLYRHFPTREALAEAVYAAELDELAGSADELLTADAPEVALRVWMDRFADYIATKRGMADALRPAVERGDVNRDDSRARLSVAVRAILDAGAAAGTLRGDVEPVDVVASTVGVMLATDDPRGDQAGRMLDLIVAGLRPR